MFLNELVATARTREDHLSAVQKAGLGKLGLFENGELRITVFSRAESNELGGVAALFTRLLDLLQRHRAVLESTHNRSPYKEETTFNEFFMWWYQLPLFGYDQLACA